MNVNEKSMQVENKWKFCFLFCLFCFNFVGIEGRAGVHVFRGYGTKAKGGAVDTAKKVITKGVDEVKEVVGSAKKGIEKGVHEVKGAMGSAKKGMEKGVHEVKGVMGAAKKGVEKGVHEVKGVMGAAKKGMENGVHEVKGEVAEAETKRNAKGVHVVKENARGLHVVKKNEVKGRIGRNGGGVKLRVNAVVKSTGTGAPPAAGGAKVNSSAPSGGTGNFNVKDFGARADGRNDDTQAFVAAWKAACAATGSVTFVVPKATYLIGQIKFNGPCKNVKSLTFQLQGFLKASTDLKAYADQSEWIEFGWIDGLTLTGGGTIDGQGAASWPFNKCPTNKNCKTLPSNLKFVQTTKTTVRGLTSLNSKFFHMAILDCKDFTASGIKISAPGNSPNTDGIHIERSSGVTISDSVIGTGDDCVSIGHGNSKITISGITCGPGHGISVGSLGRYANEGDVNGLVIKDCTLTGTTNGIRIKTWENSPEATTASNMTFENIVMNNVANPIIIDQTYCPYTSCSSAAPSRVKLSDLSFKNIRGTSSSPVAVTLECSKGNPCQNVKLEDVHLDLSSGGTKAKSVCNNVKAVYSGTQIPPPCA